MKRGADAPVIVFATADLSIKCAIPINSCHFFFFFFQMNNTLFLIYIHFLAKRRCLFPEEKRNYDNRMRCPNYVHTEHGIETWNYSVLLNVTKKLRIEQPNLSDTQRNSKIGKAL
ncbi:hypothetical protein XENTR_v10017997 [Xenopus tropicalis]|nr:hypothetical protein XENTR_v10017997 [Xenopus tropicalis]